MDSTFNITLKDIFYHFIKNKFICPLHGRVELVNLRHPGNYSIHGYFDFACEKIPNFVAGE